MALSLADLTKATEDAYGDFTVDGGEELGEVRFRNPLRMNEEERLVLEKSLNFQGRIAEDLVSNTESNTLVTYYRDMLLAAAADKATAQKLLDKIGDDPGMVFTLGKLYCEAVQMGEA